MRIAAIDIGTNSLHMIVVRLRPDLSFEVIDREKEMVRLGASGLDGRRLTPEAMEAALLVLSKFKRLAESHRVEEIIAAATSATREAENGGEFLHAVVHRTGIRPRVVSGTEEARLVHLAATYGVGAPGEASAVLDIGGGSVEVTRGVGQRVDVARSFKLGVIRVTERYVKSDPLTARDERRLVRHIEEVVDDHLDAIADAGFDRIIGTSGTVLSLGAIIAADAGRPPGAPLRNWRVPAKQIHRLRKRLVGMTLAQRLRVPGLDPKRADLAPAGAILLDTIVRRLGGDELTLCDLSLREGLIIDYIRTHRAHIAKADRYPDVRRRSVIELAERCNYWPEHAHQVARLALGLFDQSRAVHGLTDRERELLEYAAFLHDVGVHISYLKHHKHSYYLIKNGDLRGFEPEEVDIIALVARYHRRATPKKRHEGFSELDRKTRRTVRALGALLRLAESLDRSRSQSISAVELHEREGELVLEVKTSGDAELELWSARRHAAPLERLLGKPLRFEVSATAYVEQPDTAARVSGQAVRRRRDRRERQDDAARVAGEVADRRGTPGVRHGMELVRPGEGRDEDREEEERPDPDDVQPAARHGLR